MITSVRAAISIVMLLGFYVLAFAVIGGLGWVTVWMFQEHHSIAGKLAVVTIGVAAGILIALWKVLRAKPEPPSGLPLPLAQAPELWAHVTGLAAEEKTRKPDQILLVPDVNAAVSEDARLLGLVAGRRTLYIGAPLLQAFTVAQLRSVLAHELGHYSGSHTRLGAVAYRGRIAIIGTVEQLSGFWAWLFKVYARIYFLVEATVSRRQELEADRASVRVAGRATAQSALRELPVLDAAWSFYLGQYISAGWEAGYAPNDVFGGFGSLVAGRSAELAKLRAAAAPDQQSVWDSHPPIGARIAAMDGMADSPVVPDTRPASVLIPNFEQACQALATTELNIGTRKLVPWDEFTSVGVTAVAQDQADQIYRAVARATGAKQADLGSVLDVVEAGRLGTLAGPFAQEPPAELVEVLVGLAAVRSGAASWRHSWSGPARLVRPDGSSFDAAEIAALAVTPETVGTARRRLGALGIDISKATLVEAVATARGGDIIGGMATVKVDDVPHDVLILDNGVILIRCPKKADGGKRRLAELANSAPVEQLASQHTFLPYEEVAAVTVMKQVPVKLQVTLHDGRTLTMQETWSGESLTSKCRDTLQAGLTSRLSEEAAAAQ